MPRDAYQGYPTVPLSDRPIPGISVNAPASAFGGASGAALQQGGRALEHDSDQIFARALALQQDANHTAASEADNQFMLEAGKLHAEFGALQGRDAALGLEGYTKKLQDLQSKIGEGLTNPAAKRLYDSSSHGTLARTIFNAAGHAASENKKWAIGTAQSQMELDANEVSGSPEDDLLFQRKIERTVGNAKYLAAQRGFGADSPQEKLLVQEQTSKLWLQRVIGMSRTAPFEAGKMLDAFGQNMTEGDRLRAEGIVRGQSRAVGSVNIANDVFDAGRETETESGKSLEQMEAEVRKRAKEQAPNDPILEQHAVTALQGRWNQDKRVKAVELNENKQTVAAAILKGVKNEQELRADPKVAAAIDALPEKERLAIPGQINRYNSDRDRVANQANFDRLRGLASNDVEGFLRTDLSKEQLSRGDLSKLMSLREKLIAQPLQDPRVGRALTAIRNARGSELQALGIYRRDPNRPEDYDQYVGALQSAIDVWQETHGKPPGYKDVVENIAPDVIKQVPSYHSWIWGDVEAPRFKVEIPDAWRKAVIGEITARGGKEPSEQLLRRAYMREQFQRLYSKPAAKPGPAVPVSQ